MKKQYGMTLIEIMIALALGLFIIAATLSVYVNTIKASSNTIKSARLNHDLGMAMSLMTNDIKRAGFWGGAVLKASTLTNPFTTATPTTNINTFNFTAPSTSAAADPGNCIVYTYDGLLNNAAIAATGALPAVLANTLPNGSVDAGEYYGFRLIVENGVGSIQMRTTGTTTANCTDGNWERITDENTVNITSLQFSFATMAAQAATATIPAFPALTATSRCVVLTATTSTTTNALSCATVGTGDHVAQKRIINIRIAGQLIGADNAEVIKGLSASIKVRNNRTYKQ